MFKSKKSIYILLPVNLFIWGFIAYKIYSALNEDDDIAIPESATVKPKPRLNDTLKYVLQLNYNDPFLKDAPAQKKLITNSRNSTTPVAATNKPVKNIPETQVKEVKDIKYLGLVQSTGTGNSTALIAINGKSYIVKKGETIEGYKIKSIDNSAIALLDGKKVISVQK